jgi:recombinational DNA repair protein RecR
MNETPQVRMKNAIDEALKVLEWASKELRYLQQENKKDLERMGDMLLICDHHINKAMCQICNGVKAEEI